MNTFHPLESQYSSKQMWLLRGTCFFYFMAFGLVVTFETVWMKDHQVKEGTIGNLMSMSTVITLFVGLLIARIVDRSGRPDRVFILGCVLLAGALYYFTQVTTAGGFTPYWIVRGIAWPMTVTMLPLMAVTLMGKHAAGRGYAFYRVFGSIGYCIGLLVIARNLESTNMIILVAGVGVFLALIPIAFCKLPKPEHKHFAPLKEIVRHRDLMILVVATFFFTMASPAVFPFATTYARELGADDKFISLFGAFNGLLAIVGLPLTGIAIDRFGPKSLIWIGLIAQPLRAVGLSFCSSYEWMLIPQAFHIFTWAGFEIASVLLVTRLAGPGGRATALTLFTSAHMLGAIIAAPLTGYLAQSQTFGYTGMQRIMGGIASIGFFVFAVNALIVRRNNNKLVQAAAKTVAAEDS